MGKRKMQPTSLMEYICQAIDEALPTGAAVTGRDLYLRGFDRYMEAHFERERKRVLRELEASIPLLVPSDVIEDHPGTQPGHSLPPPP